jgi:hypothetical protein
MLKENCVSAERLLLIDGVSEISCPTQLIVVGEGELLFTANGFGSSKFQYKAHSTPVSAA